jgi:hypothetical protein
MRNSWMMHRIRYKLSICFGHRLSTLHVCIQQDRKGWLNKALLVHEREENGDRIWPRGKDSYYRMNREGEGYCRL